MSSILKDKKIVYGLLVGAAVLVSAALISHYYSDKQTDTIDDEIGALGVL